MQRARRSPRRTGLTQPVHSGELVTLTTPSGHSLAVTAIEPRGLVRSTTILLHPMMASRRVFHAPHGGRGLAEALADCKLRVLSLDFRGHGESTPAASAGGMWNYDDLVREDLPCLIQAARDRWPSDPLYVVGHSLGAHVALACAACAYAEIDGLVMLAGAIWLPELEANPARRAKKAGVIRVARAFARVPGYLPARALRLGSDDESGRFILQVTDWWSQAAWTNADASIDYADEAARLKIPTLTIASAGDDWESPPDATYRFMKKTLGHQAKFELLRCADDGGPAPDHMGIVTTRAAQSIWNRVARFCAAGSS